MPFFGRRKRSVGEGGKEGHLERIGGGEEGRKGSRGRGTEAELASWLQVIDSQLYFKLNSQLYFKQQVKTLDNQNANISIVLKGDNTMGVIFLSVWFEQI